MSGLVDASGHRLQLGGGRPERIVSLVPSLSETLAAVGVADRVVGVTDHCVWPPAAFDHAARVRGTKNPDVSAIAALQPDLVLANLEENRERHVVALRETGITVHVSYPRDVLDAAATIRTVSQLVGEAEAGDGIATGIEEAHAAAHRRGGGRTLRVLCPIWRDPWMAVGEGCYAAELLEVCGLRTQPRTGERYPRLDPDRLRGEIDAVLLPSEPYAFGEEHLAEWEDWAVPIRLIDGALLTWHGPRTVDALERFTPLTQELVREAG